MVEQKQIDRTEAKQILEIPEGHFADVKRIEITPAKLSESISAFANAAGGELYVGVGEVLVEDGLTKKRFWKGFETMEAANGIFQVLERIVSRQTFTFEFLITALKSKAQVGCRDT
jgi:ATP-dependent DNA helicase RecG